jgi:hypothetical protein
MNQRDESVDYGVWDFAIRVTGWAAGGGGIFMMLITVIGALLLLEGYVTQWVR